MTTKLDWQREALALRRENTELRKLVDKLEQRFTPIEPIVKPKWHFHESLDARKQHEQGL